MTEEFRLCAGIIIRGRAIRELRSAAWDMGLDISVDENKGLLASDYKVKVTGKTPQEEKIFVAAATKAMADFNAR